mmetsp:Transcript_62297/g.181980  ORF Transcript_62297/g.181980 Transcript_62297/m.181980 type:complete len:303 (+) Transcript_62297:61-969(+)
MGDASSACRRKRPGPMPSAGWRSWRPGGPTCSGSWRRPAWPARATAASWRASAEGWGSWRSPAPAGRRRQPPARARPRPAAPRPRRRVRRPLSRSLRGRWRPRRSPWTCPTPAKRSLGFRTGSRMPPTRRPAPRSGWSCSRTRSGSSSAAARRFCRLAVIWPAELLEPAGVLRRCHCRRRRSGRVPEQRRCRPQRAVEEEMRRSVPTAQAKHLPPGVGGRSGLSARSLTGIWASSWPCGPRRTTSGSCLPLSAGRWSTARAPHAPRTLEAASFSSSRSLRRPLLVRTPRPLRCSTTASWRTS